MAGIHHFTSSNWIQSGSQAQFINGINVVGGVTADSFVGDGSLLTGVSAEKFFAGSGSGVSASTPQSIDHVIKLASGQSNALPGTVLIQTTSSGNFKPNYFSFVKIQDTFVTRQVGGLNSSSYVGRDDYPSGDADGQFPYENDLAPGVHRYIVYATESGSAQDTQIVYSTVFIKGFINLPPTIIRRDDMHVTMSHDSDQIDVIMHFTGSFDENANDFIRAFSASRVGTDPSITSTEPSFALLMKHPQADIVNSNEFIFTGSFDTVNSNAGGFGPNAVALLDNSLVFTASITNYNVVNGTTVNTETIVPYQETFTIMMQDNNQFFNSSSVDVTLTIAPPATASIKRPRIQIEDGAFTGIGVTTHTTPILYDFTATLDSTASFKEHVSASMYTSSLVRLAAMADIQEPQGFESDEDLTTIQFLSNNVDSAININSDTFKYFRFSGTAQTASAYHNSDINHATNYSNVTESLGFTPFVFGPSVTTFGTSETSETQNNTDYIRHGDHNHYFHNFTDNRSTLTVTTVPNIEISNVVVEVESDSFGTNTGSFERSASVLYGYSNTLLSSETGSFESHENFDAYLSESVVRVRLLATITEPFGPHHTDMESTIQSDVGSHSHTFNFHTGSGATHCVASSSEYNSQNQLVGRYTSSWKEFQLTPGEYVFSPSFNNSTNAGREVIDQRNAEVSVSATPATEITNIVYETETFGYSDIGSVDTMRTVLYGTPHHTLINSASFEVHDSASLYASHSVSRFRVLATVTEPFGPHHASSSFTKVWSSGGQQTAVDTFTADETSNSGNGIVFNGTVNDNSNTQGWSPTAQYGDFSAGIPNYNSNAYYNGTEATDIRYNHGSPILIGQAKIDLETNSYNPVNVTIYGSNTNNGSDWETLATTDSTLSTTETTLQWIPQQSYQWYKFEFNPDGSFLALNYIKLYDGTTSGTTTGFTDISSSILFSTGSVHTASSAIAYDAQNRLVAHYTSSWVGQQLSASAGSTTSWTYTSGSILHTPYDASGFITESGQSTTMVVHDTPKVAIEEVFWETETHGYSNEEKSNAQRTVLYGDSRVTNASSASTVWESHNSASKFASQSVSRIRFRAKVTEPIGPVVHQIQVNADYDTDGSVNYMIDTGSIEAGGSVTHNYESNQLVTRYTQSFTGRTFNAAAGGNTVYDLTGDFTEQAVGENGFTISETNGQLTVFDTPPTVVENIFVETEIHGHETNAPTQSGVTGAQRRTVLYGTPHYTLADSSSFEVHDSASLYASQSVSRFRVRARIIEPVGWTSSITTVTKKLESSGQSDITETILFATNSADITKNIYYDTSNRLIGEYTSAFSGSELSVVTAGTRNWTATATINHSPTNENSHTSAGPTTTVMTVIDTPPTQIVNYKLETETRGESGIGIQNPSYGNATDITRSILYGETTTRATGSDLADIYDPHAVTRFRILTEITEPVGPLHHSSSIRYYKNNQGNGGGGGVYSNTTIAFSTASTQTASSAIAYDDQSRLVGRYTSSWIGEELPFSYRNDGDAESRWLFQIFSGQVKHDPIGENGENASGTSNLYFVVSASNPLQIEGLRVETEAFPYSSSIGTDSRTQKLLYGYNRTLSASDANDIGDIWSGSAAIRFRILGTVIEPLGLSHFETEVSASNSVGQTFGFKFYTGSGAENTASSTVRTLNSDNLFIQSFTSSWYDKLTFPAGNFEFTASAKTGSNTTGVYIINSTGNAIETGSVVGADITITSSDPTQITNLRVETEKEFSGSTAGTSSRVSKMLHGREFTETDNDVNATYPNLASRQQLVSARVLADIQEPFGPHHAPTTITMAGFDAIARIEPDSTVAEGAEYIPLATQLTASHYYGSGKPANVLLGTSDWYDYESQTNKLYNVGTGRYNDVPISAHTATSEPVLWFAIDMLEPTVLNYIQVKYYSGNNANERAQISGSNVYPYATGSVDWTPLFEPASDNGARVQHYRFTNDVPYRFYRITFPSAKWEDTDASVRGAEDIRFFRPAVSVAPGLGTQLISLSTSSADVSKSIELSYETHGSQSVSYTSSFAPIEFINSGSLYSTPKEFNISASTVLHEFNDNKTFEYAEISESIVTILPAETASVSIALAKSGDDLTFSSSTDLPTYVTYNEGGNDITIDLVSGVSASSHTTTSISHVTFPDHVVINYDDNANANLSFNPAKSTGLTDSTSSLTIASSHIDTLTKVEHFTVFASASATESGTYFGQGSSSVSEFTFAVVPSKPRSMEGRYWGSSTANSHASTGNTYGEQGINFVGIGGNTHRLYKAALPSGLGSYKSGHSAGTNVSNVILAKESHTGPVNYSMSFTPFTPATTGNYADDDRLFDFGDSGSLIVKINGVEVVNYDIGGEFESADKAGEQDIAANYTGNGTASFTAPHEGLGRLIVTTVQPFNEVSQSIQNGVEYYPNGYQGWSARIEIDNKLNDGYNNLEFSHSINQELTQSWKPFDWYYDDGISGSAIISTLGEPTLSYAPFGASEPTFSISGVSFFKELESFTITLQDRIHGITHNTYRDSDASTDIVAEVSQQYNALIQMSTGSSGNQGTLEASLHDLPNNLNGLQFKDTALDTVPSAYISASFSNIKIMATSVTNEDKGQLYLLKFNTYQRDLTVEDGWDSSANTLISIGRFIDVGSISSTNAFNGKTSDTITEDFFNESFRWTSASYAESASLNYNKGGGSGNSNYGTANAGGTPGGASGYADFWLRGHYSESRKDPSIFTTDYIKGPNFISNVSLAGTNELQQLFTGKLVYPALDYTTNTDAFARSGFIVNPNAPDYSSETGDKFYCRAFEITGNTVQYIFLFTDDSNRDNFRITSANIESGVGLDDRPVRIDVALPGPTVSAGTTNSSTNPGIQFQNALQENQGSFLWQSSDLGVLSSMGDYEQHEFGAYRIKIDFGAFSPNNAGNVMLMRIRIKNSYNSNSIKAVHVSANGSGEL